MAQLMGNTVIQAKSSKEFNQIKDILLGKNNDERVRIAKEHFKKNSAFTEKNINVINK